VKIVRLYQAFDGSYHIVVDGVIEAFSLTLGEAQRWAKCHGCELR
jgi:hypothetical protein